MKSDDTRQWLKEFQEFLESNQNPPKGNSQTLLAKIRAGLHPSLSSILLKVLGIHTVVGFLTLFFCPQFGVNLGTSWLMNNILMMYGSAVCSLTCGALFLGVSATINLLFLNLDELRVLKQHQISPWFGLATLSFFLFFILGNAALELLSLVWIVGACVAGWMTTQVGYHIRLLRTHRV